MPRYGPPGYPAPGAAAGYYTAPGAPTAPPPTAPPPVGPPPSAAYPPFAPSGYVTGAPAPVPGAPPGYAPYAAPGYAVPTAPPAGYGVPTAPPAGYAVPTAPPAAYAVPTAPPAGYGLPTAPPAAGPRGAPPQLIALFGPTPAVLQPRSRLQALLVRNTSARAAANPWLMAAVGAVLATLVGLVLVAIAESVIGGIIGKAIASWAGGTSAGTYLTVLHAIPTPSLLSVFAVIQGVPLALQVNASAAGASVGGQATFSLPLTSLVILPLAALVLGGYLSAASDYTGRPRYCVARGALIGPAYAIVLAVLAMVGTQSVSTSFFGPTTASASISVPIGQSFLLGLVWGCIFGALGGYIQARGGQWLRALPGDLTAVRWRQLAAATVGAVAALLSMLVFATCVLLALAAAGAISATSQGADGLPLYTMLRDGNLLSLFQNVPQPGQPPAASVGGALALVLSLAPTLAIWLVALGGGASITATETGFSSNGPRSTDVSLGLLNGQHPSPAVYLLALIPLGAYFIGGRVAARVAGTAQSRALNGALMAVPLSILMALATTLTGIGGRASAGTQTASASIAPSFGSVFLWTLVVGAIVGALGGLSAGSGLLGRMPRFVTVPLRPLVYPLFDRVMGTARDTRGAAVEWLYDAVIVGIVLSVLLIVLDLLAGVLSSLITPTGFTIAQEVLTLLLAIVPACYALGGLFAAVPAAPAPATPTLATPAVPAVTAAPVYASAPAVPPGGPYS